MSLLDFESQLDKDPANWDLRLIYSDYLEEKGNISLAQAQRWMASEKKHSTFCTMHDLVNTPPRIKWIWGDIDAIEPKTGILEKYQISMIPEEVFTLLEETSDTRLHPPLFWKYYYTRVEAERVLGNALVKLEEKKEIGEFISALKKVIEK